MLHRRAGAALQMGDAPDIGRHDDIGFDDVIKGVVPFILLMFCFLALIIAVPGISTWLPSLMPTRGVI